MSIELPSNSWSPEAITNKEQAIMLEELTMVSNGDLFVEYESDNLLNFDGELERGKAVANYVSAPIRRAVKNRREGKHEDDKPKHDADEGVQLKLGNDTDSQTTESTYISRLNPPEVRQKNKRQALAIMGAAAGRATVKLAEVKSTHEALEGLHKRAVLPAEGDTQTPAEIILEDSSEGVSLLESLGMFARELDKKNKAKGGSTRFVDLLNLALDENDGSVLDTFISATRTNTGVRVSKYMRQAQEFDIAMDVWRGRTAHADAYSSLQSAGYTSADQVAYIEQRTKHVEGPSRNSTE